MWTMFYIAKKFIMDIIAIGGGKIAEQETLHIDTYIAALAHKATPNVLFVPTASMDDGTYCSNFRSIYQNLLGCQVKELLVYRERPDYQKCCELIHWADIIYVGGGNTLMMMRKWRQFNIDQLLISRVNQPVILCGTSAGAICWFESGHSDSMSFYHPENWDYIRVRGLGLLPWVACPHFMAEGRQDSFRNMIRKVRKSGIALDNKHAIHFHGGTFKILAPAINEVGCFLVSYSKGRLTETSLVSTTGFQPIDF